MSDHITDNDYRHPNEKHPLRFDNTVEFVAFIKQQDR